MYGKPWMPDYQQFQKSEQTGNLEKARRNRLVVIHKLLESVDVEGHEIEVLDKVGPCKTNWEGTNRASPAGKAIDNDGVSHFLMRKEKRGGVFKYSNLDWPPFI